MFIKPSDNRPPTLEWIKKLPKTDLHVHIGGSLRIKTLIELAKKNKVKLPTYNPKELRKLVVMQDNGCHSLAQYLKSFDITESVLCTEEALERAAYELAEDAARENVWCIEVRFGPTNYMKYGMKLPFIIEAVLRGLKRAQKKFGIHTGLILSGMRSDKHMTEIAAEMAVNYQYKGVVGFDLAGPELGNEPRSFADIFRIIHDNFVYVTIHAGEECDATAIADAINYLNARRIGHGTKVLQNEKLLNYIRDNRIGIEVCPSSNIHTCSSASYQSHPLRTFLQENLRVTINTDNRLISNTNITKEMWLASTNLGLTRADLKMLVKNGFKSLFMNYNRKKPLELKVLSVLEKM